MADGWITAQPEEVGIDSAPFLEMLDFIRERQIPVHSVQIVRRGKLVLDAYIYPFEPARRHDVASVTKSVTSLLTGLAIDRRHLPDAGLSLRQAFPDRHSQASDERRNRITIEHLLSMTAGWDCGLEPKEARLFEMRRSTDWLQFMLDLPMLAEPGTRWAYCSGNCHILSILLTRVTGTNALAFARQHLFAPLGIHDVAWPADPAGNNHGWGDLQLRPRDMAKIGQLMLQRGRWEKRQILSERWVEASIRPHVQSTSNDDRYGYFWWIKDNGIFEAVGRGGQRISVWPAQELVVVLTGGGFEPGELAGFIFRAIKSEKGLPANRKASAQLKQRLAIARNAPRRSSGIPALARAVSARRFRLSPNALQLESLRLHFAKGPQARAEFVWLGRTLNFPIGLDGRERFSINSITKLRQAAKGEWIDERTFALQLDLIGAINCYRFQLTFLDSDTLVADVSERTGLSEARFEGKAP